jgi:hypothetical protein
MSTDLNILGFDWKHILIGNCHYYCMHEGNNFYISTFLLVLSAIRLCLDKSSAFRHYTDPPADANASEALAAVIYKADRMSTPNTKVQYFSTQFHYYYQIINNTLLKNTLKVQ